VLKRILLGLDNSEPGKMAQAYALKLAKSCGAQVTGLGILDTPWLTAAQPEPLGGTAYKIERDEVVLEHAQAQVTSVMKAFKEQAEKAKVEATAFEVEGFPVLEIERISHEHDVIVMGQRANFHFDMDDESDLAVKHLAHDNPRPVIVVPASYHPGEDILVAYDGSVGASRSLHMFILLGLAKGKKVHVLSCDEDGDIAAAHAQQADRLLQAHGIEAKKHTLITSGKISDHIVAQAEKLKIALLVMGAYSHTPLHDVFFGSATKKLMATATFPLFLHH
jgi:nucleotide-binding universal stress UspA family protein